MKRLKQIIHYINHHPLAGRHKLKAYYRFFKWQVSQSIFPHEKKYPFAGNTKLVVKKGLHGATGNIYTGLHDFSDMGFLLHFLRKGDMFFDIGANVGSYTVLASGCIGSRTVAFEPVPSTFNWLQKNIDVNNLDTLVKALQVGVGSSKGILHFTNRLDTVNHVVTGPGNNKAGDYTEIPVVDLDSIAITEGTPVLVKIDVEGFETEVLTGMSRSLRSEELKAIIIELNGSGGRYGFDEELIHSKLLEHHFLPYQYFPFERRLCLLDHFGPFNTIYIRDIDHVKKRLVTANKIKVFSEFV